MDYLCFIDDQKKRIFIESFEKRCKFCYHSTNLKLILWNKYTCNCTILTTNLFFQVELFTIQCSDTLMDAKTAFGLHMRQLLRPPLLAFPRTCPCSIGLTHRHQLVQIITLAYNSNHKWYVLFLHIPFQLQVQISS